MSFICFIVALTQNNKFFDSIFKKRLLSKLASGSKMIGDLGAHNPNVLSIREDSSTKSFAAVCSRSEFGKKYNAKILFQILLLYILAISPMNVSANQINNGNDNIFVNYITTKDTKEYDAIDNFNFIRNKIASLLEFTDLFATRISASSIEEFQNNRKYADVVKNSLNPPVNLTLRTSFHLNDSFDVLLDVKKTFFRAEQFYKNAKYKDQMTYMAGLEFNHVDNLSIRAGYNYGKSYPKSTDTVFTKFLSPNFAKHHLTAGLLYKYSDNVNLSLIGQQSFSKKLIDTRSGNLGIFGKASFVKPKGQTSVHVGAMVGF